MSPTGELETQVKPMLPDENKLTDWDEIEAYFKTCVVED